MVPNHSTVTNLSERDELDFLNYFIEFTVTVSSSNLNNYFYSEHQQYLYDTIKELHGKGLGYRRISHILFERGYRSVRTKSVLHNNYVYSIYKKGKIREERIDRSFDSELTNMKVKICNFNKT